MSATEVRRPRLHHVNLKTNKLDELIDWYTAVLGMEVVHKFPGGAWLSNDDANHRIALLASPGVVDHPDRVVHSTCWSRGPGCASSTSGRIWCSTTG
jgi:catechol 2,3-dioxygenase